MRTPYRCKDSATLIHSAEARSLLGSSRKCTKEITGISDSRPKATEKGEIRRGGEREGGKNIYNF